MRDVTMSKTLASKTSKPTGTIGESIAEIEESAAIPPSCWIYGCPRPPTTTVSCSVPSLARFIKVWVCAAHAASAKGAAGAKAGR
jgi:hypothetical protein